MDELYSDHFNIQPINDIREQFSNADTYSQILNSNVLYLSI